MKKFDELTENQKNQVINNELGFLLEAIVTGVIRFNDEYNQNDLQARIDKAITKANEMETPWFAHEYIMDTCEKELKEIAIALLQNCLFAEKNEPRVIHLEN